MIYKYKIKDLPIDDCIINTMFTDAKDPKKWRLEYCKDNCNYRCLKGKNYKRRNDAI